MSTKFPFWLLWRTSDEPHRIRRDLIRVLFVIVFPFCVVYGVAAYRYLTPPIFSSDEHFGTSDRKLLDSWTACIDFNQRQIIACDPRINMGVVIEADFEKVGNYGNPWDPERGRTFAVWKIGDRSIRVDAQHDKFLLIAADGTIRRFSLPPGYIREAIRDKKVFGSLFYFDDFKRVFSDVIKSDSAENDPGAGSAMQQGA